MSSSSFLSMYFLCSSCHWVIVDLVLRSFILPFLIVIVQKKCTWVCYCKGMFFFFIEDAWLSGLCPRIYIYGFDNLNMSSLQFPPLTRGQAAGVAV